MDYEKGQINTMKDANKSFRRIAEAIGRSVDVVINYCNNPDTYGTNYTTGRPSKLTELTTAITNEWRKIDQNLLKKLVESMKNRCIQVIERQGARIDY